VLREPLDDVKCPIACGVCCDQYWRDAVDAPAELLQCPHQGKKSCTLPRAQRPEGCREYLCDLADAVLNGRMTKKRACRYQILGLHFEPQYRELEQ